LRNSSIRKLVTSDDHFHPEHTPIGAASRYWNLKKLIPHGSIKGLYTSTPDFDNSFFSIASKTGRDLVWSVFGPALINSSYAPDLRALLPQLTLDLCNRVDTVDIDFNSPRLGFCFEQMWQQALTMAGISYVANTQITSPQRTLGELDLLINQANKTLHAELALKFYLGVEDDWIGPNRRDLLSQKIAHTTSHQLPLASTNEGLTAIKNAGFNNEVTSVAIMRGCLFHPAHNLTPAPLPQDVAHDHWRGQWCPVSQLHLIPEGHWYVLSKQDWISPVLASFSIDREELIHYLSVYFDHLTTPMCIARVNKGPYGWAEAERWMIVPADWEDS
jgi:hypothetical protein